jgi:hypothetical protein
MSHAAEHHLQSVTEIASDPAPRPRTWRLGVGAHLALGMAIMGVVVLMGQVVTDRITHTAVEAVSSLQLRYEPEARRAGAIIEKLAAFDRQVEESLGPDGSSVQAKRSAQTDLQAATAELNQAIDVWYRRSAIDSTVDPQGPGQVQLKQQIGAHMAAGQALAGESGQRQQWLSRRHQLLEAEARRIAKAGGTGNLVGTTEVVGRKSLVELSQAAAALRAVADLDGDSARAEQDFKAALDRNNDELMRSPGAAWMEIIREDLRDAVNLRNEVNRFDASNERDRHDFLRTGAQLISDAQMLLEAPARNALAAAAQRAAQAAKNAQHALVTTGITVEVVLVLVLSKTAPAHCITLPTTTR